MCGPSENPLCHHGRVRQEVKGLRECPETLGIFQMDLDMKFSNEIGKFWSLIKTHHLLVCNIINMMPYNGSSQMLYISLKTEKIIYRPPLMPAVRCWPWAVFSSWLASRGLRYSMLQLLGESGACVHTYFGAAGAVNDSPTRPSVCLYFYQPIYPERFFHSNSARILDVGLKFCWVIHSTMKQITF